MNFKKLQYEVHNDDIDNAVLSALESQFKATALQLNRDEFLLHKYTEIALGKYYNKISKRGIAEQPAKTHISNKFFKTILNQDQW